jgi:hypothetical protein
MKRVFTATCLAATFAVGLAAQSTTSSPTQTTPPGQRGGGPRTVTGCLRAGDTAGSFMLTDVQMQGGRAGGTTAGTTGGTTAGGTTAGGTTAGGTTAGGTGTDQQSGRAMTPMSVTLVPGADVDLKAHVGHKIEVTGTMAGGRGGAGTTAGGTTAGGTTTGGTTAGGTTAGGTTAGGTTTGTGGTTGTGTTASGQGRGPRSMNVTSVRMISESCS